MDALFNKALDIDNQGKYAEAITYYDKALAVDANNVNALNNKGLALSNLGKYNETIEFYDKALEIQPSDALALNNKRLALDFLNKINNKGNEKQKSNIKNRETITLRNIYLYKNIWGRRE